jgi:CRP-like cAMP-binding protein
MITENVLRNRTCGELTPDERAILEAAFSGTKLLREGQVAVVQGEPVDVSILLIEGFMTRHIHALDGRRHMVGVHVPGDFVDLHAYALKKLDHDVAALTPARVGLLRHADIERIQQDHAHLTKRLWFLTLLDAAIHRQWVYRIASLTAIERVAHFLCEINARLLAVGLSDGTRFELPMTQVDIGEVCSLTNVHVNRVLRQLRERGLCAVRQSQVDIHDMSGLAAAGQFDPSYLYLNRQTAERAGGAPWNRQ